MRTPRAAVWALVSLSVLTPLALAQDSHYWTNQYGTRATLLGGAVIGSVLDLSGTYYNPGGLSLLEKPATVMAAQVFQYPRLTLAGNDQSAVPQNSYNLAPAPSLLAGTIRVRGLEKHWFGYSFLARQSVKLGRFHVLGRHPRRPARRRRRRGLCHPVQARREDRRELVRPDLVL